jgi:predicted TIM-barrel fold metal-dependent hydrolase
MMIALEEHFALPDTLGDSEQYAISGTWGGLAERLLDLGAGRIAEMDAHGIELAILSLNSPAVQAIPDAATATDVARRANDVLASAIAQRPDRFAGFAALPMQDPDAASAELTRAVRDLGFKGALVNGFSQTGSPDRVIYYDDGAYSTFWATVEQLAVPFYLHPRDPLASREPIYDGHPWLRGPAWAFAAETSLHALRLITNGLFDRHPRLQLILGHLGEGIPYNVWRLDHRIRKSPRGVPARRTVGEYLRSNVYLTTSGNFRTATLEAAIAEVGLDRLMFSVDYPFEQTLDAVGWFRTLDRPDADLAALAHGNARALFKLPAPAVDRTVARGQNDRPGDV